MSNTIGTNLRKYRMQCGYTPKRLADMVEIAKEILLEIEAGKRIPVPELVEELAAAVRQPAHRIYGLPELRTHYKTIAKITETGDGEEVTILFGGKRALDTIMMHPDGITIKLQRWEEEEASDD